MNDIVKKLFVFCLVSLFPVLVFAQDSGGSLSFAPPVGDYSMQFLENVFGQVDGTLYGTGSQIMGTIFGVFNSAVMALGGIVIMYTLLVSTMNTAQEGQLLGQKWSSIWIPIRSTIGLALLIPKASGYCMMQIFIMWIVVQGVGAADKVWNSALDYLARGGSIVQPNMDPGVSINGDDGAISDGATVMLAGQVCMGALQQILTNQRESYVDSESKNAGPCSGTPSDTMSTFCQTAVPDFINSFNAVATQNVPLDTLLTQNSFSTTMPNFPTSNPYSVLNGICGTVTWNNFVTSSLQGQGSQDSKPSSWEGMADNLASSGLTLGTGNLQTVAMSRAIAVQQMYQELSLVAREMVNNMPGLNTDTSDTTTTATPVSKVAMQPYGVPLTSSNAVCTAQSQSDCIDWGTPVTASQAPLLSGIEYQGAISNYNAIMKPALTLLAQAQASDSEKQSKDFINTAESQGWIMAGSYFFDLAQLNINAQQYSDITDSTSGLSSSAFSPQSLTEAFGDNRQCQGAYQNLCTWLQGNNSDIKQIISVINGTGLLPTTLSKPAAKGGIIGDLNANNPPVATSEPAASTVYGYIENASILQLPGQPGQTGPSFGMNLNVDLGGSSTSLQDINLDCFGKIMGVCLGSSIVEGIYNNVIVDLLNALLAYVMTLIMAVIQAFLMIPLVAVSLIFQKGVSYITSAGVDPIVGLSNMGVYYINFSNDLVVYVLGIVGIISATGVGTLFLALLALIMPIFLAWLGIMVTVGFITAYYIPFVPYMIFTFGSIAWLMAVIEAMVAGPIIALGVTHPEGNEAFGKGEQAIMLILNVFLRPSMMVIGFIGGIILSYVSVWILNSGFGHVASIMSGSADSLVSVNVSTSSTSSATDAANQISSTGYSSWAGIYASFFSLLMYTALYLIVVQKSFTLITLLPDKILRWIGGQPESIGAETAQWGEEAKSQVKEAGGSTQDAGGQAAGKLAGGAAKGVKKIKDKFSGGSKGGVSAGQSADSTKSDSSE